MIISSKVPSAFNGFLLIDYLAARFTYLKREIWIERISENRFKKNETVLDKNDVVFQEDVIVYDMPDLEEPNANFDYKIIKQTDDFLAIDKPYGLMVHRHGMNYRNNLIYHLRNLHEPLFPTADTVNRLDQNTSGIVLISLNKKALRELSLQFMDKSIKKTYFAVVLGTPNPLCGEISAPIARIKKNIEKNNNKGRFCEVNLLDGKPCLTLYETMISKNGLSLVKLFPQTGRTHQIRIHLSYIGNPIIGDMSYGTKECTFEMNRHLLHCASMEFMFRGNKIVVNSQLPDEFDIVKT
jgi:23S rRNA pseudouridine1911/1915/1917 synthase